MKQYFGVTVHYFIQITLVFGKNKKNFAITSQSPRKYCYFGVFEIFLSKIMNGDPQLLFQIFKVKHLKIMC